MEITLPSGLRGEIRKLKVRELALLTDAKLARTGRLATEIVQSCWVRTLDPGPYAISDPKLPPPATSMLHADRACAFRDIRVATNGPMLEWEVQCPNENCKHRFLAAVDLTQMEVRPLPEGSRAHVATGEPFVANVAGRRVLWHLLRASDEERSIKLVNKGIPLMTVAFMCRITAVEGIDQNDPEALRAWVEDLEIEDNEAFQDEMDAREPNLSQQTDILCPQLGCSTTWRDAVPLVQGSWRKVTSKEKSASAADTRRSSALPSTSDGSTPASAGPTSG